MILPVYYKFPRDKNKTLVSLNKYERLHFQPRNKMKQVYYSLIAKTLNKIPLKGKIKTEYTYYYKNVQSDAPNVVSVIDKLFMDCLQLEGVIKEDNVLHYVGSTWSVGGQDKLNPRMEVRVIEVIEEKENEKQGVLI